MPRPQSFSVAGPFLSSPWIPANSTASYADSTVIVPLPRAPLPLLLRNVWPLNGNFYGYSMSQLTSYLILGRRLSGNANVDFFVDAREVRHEISIRYLLTSASSAMSLMKITSHIHVWIDICSDKYVRHPISLESHPDTKCKIGWLLVRSSI